MRRYTPGAKDRHIESAWLDEHYLYGGRVHEIVGEAIVGALGVASTRGVGHGLYLKLFAEFANALEVAGAWGWVIRTRRRHALLMDAFLTSRERGRFGLRAVVSRVRYGSVSARFLATLDRYPSRRSSGGDSLGARRCLASG